MSKPPVNPTDEWVETLAEIEHAQWMHWSQSVATHVPPAIRETWQRSWVDYAELTEELKELDRVWARRVVMLLRQRKLIP